MTVINSPEVSGNSTVVDPNSGAFWFISGKKKSGKSVYADRLCLGYPDDLLVVDPTGDVSVDLRSRGVEFTDLPVGREHLSRLPYDEEVPAHQRGRAVWVLRPDMGSDSSVDDIDHVVGLALRHGKYVRPVIIWFDEVGTYSRAGLTPPNLRRLLHHGRHNRMSAAMCGPRSMGVDLLCLAQADFVVTFNTPSQADRERIAGTIGWPVRKFDEACNSLGTHEYLLFDSAADDGQGTLTHMPRLPLE